MRKRTPTINIDAILAIVALVHQNDNLTQRKLANHLNLSRSTVARLIRQAADHLNVRIVWVKNGEPGDHGHYKLQDFGVLEPVALLHWARTHGYL